MNRMVVLDDWLAPTMALAATVHADESSLWLRYSTGEHSVTIIMFSLVDTFQFGSPNDEALGGDPLYANGLKFYSVHRVEDSSWIQELEKRNSVHPQHDHTLFLKDKSHYIFTFQDTTLECVVDDGEHWKPEIHVCASRDAQTGSGG